MDQLNIERRGSLVTVSVTTELLDLLQEHRVFLREYGDSSRLRIGERINSSEDVALEPYSGIFAGSSLCTMGAFSYSHSQVSPDPGLSLGRYCSVAGGIRMPGWQHPHTAVTSSLFACNPAVNSVVWAMRDGLYDKALTLPVPQKFMPRIGNDVWLCEGAVIMRGTTVGDGAIVAAEAVVTRDVPPYAIVGGNPAQFIKWRFPDEIRTALHDLAWWRYSPTDLADLPFGDPSSFIEALRGRSPSLEPWEPKPLRLWETLQAGV